jgi:hypothetical protein
MLMVTEPVHVVIYKTHDFVETNRLQYCHLVLRETLNTVVYTLMAAQPLFTLLVQRYHT